MATKPFPKLVDCRGLMDELGVKESTALAIMEKLTKVRIGRRVFVKRDDVEKHLEENEAA